VEATILSFSYTHISDSLNCNNNQLNYIGLFCLTSSDATIIMGIVVIFSYPRHVKIYNYELNVYMTRTIFDIYMQLNSWGIL